MNESILQEIIFWRSHSKYIVKNVNEFGYSVKNADAYEDSTKRRL